jgi:TIR domain-containing protein
MSDIFLSYAKEDRARARVVAHVLEVEGWSIFWDRTIPIGKTWRETIEKELSQARCVIVLWSKASIESGWVQEEADDGARRGVLVPVLIENVLPPMGFRSMQAADLSDWDGTEPTQTFDTVIAAVAGLVGPPPKGAEEKRKQTEAEAQRRAEEERKRAKPEAERRAEERKQTEARAALETAEKEARRKAAEEEEVKRKAEEQQEKRELRVENVLGEFGEHQPRQLTVGRRYMALAAAGGLLTGLLMTLNYWSYWSSFIKTLPLIVLLAYTLYGLGLVAGLVWANQPPRKTLVPKLIRVAGGIATGAIASVVASLAGEVNHLSISLLSWTITSLLSVFMVGRLADHRKDTPRNRLLWGTATGSIAGAVWATSVGIVSGDFEVPMSYAWLLLFLDGVLIGSLVGFVEYIVPHEYLNGRRERSEGAERGAGI